MAVVKCAGKVLLLCLKRENASVRCGIEERGTCREARFQSRCGGTRSILGDVKKGHGSSLMASPVSLTGGHDLLRKKCSHAHITHTLPTTPQQSPKQKQRHTNNSRIFWESYITACWLTALKSTKSYFTFQTPSEVCQLSTKKYGQQGQGTTNLLKLCRTRGMRVHWIFFF